MNSQQKEKVFKSMQILSDIPDKSVWKTTTSHFFKIGLAQFLSSNNFLDLDWIEIGAAQGMTTNFLSFLAKSIVSVEIVSENCKKIKSLNLDNVVIKNKNLYSRDFSDYMSTSKFDAAFIDAVHIKENVLSDIQNCLLSGVKIFVFDDYGAFQDVKDSVQEFLEDLVRSEKKYSLTYIGMPPGMEFPNTTFKVLQDWEGVIIEIFD